MPKHVDDEIQKAMRSGLTPAIIETGADNYYEMHDELYPTPAADLVTDREKVIPYDEEEVTEYKGLKVIRRDDVSNDYLKIR